MSKNKKGPVALGQIRMWRRTGLTFMVASKTEPICPYTGAEVQNVWTIIDGPSGELMEGWPDEVLQEESDAI